MEGITQQSSLLALQRDLLGTQFPDFSGFFGFFGLSWEVPCCSYSMPWRKGSWSIFLGTSIWEPEGPGVSRDEIVASDNRPLLFLEFLLSTFKL